jgi:hypothetical protein
MPPTESEQHFEQWCANHSVIATRITEGAVATPDYHALFGQYKVIAEVTQIERNAEERESDRLLAERGYGNATGGTPGARVRAKITGCSRQVKTLMAGVHPSILVIYSGFMGLSHIGSDQVRVAMYGLDTAHVAVPHNFSIKPYIVGWFSGGKRKLTANHNTSISAVASLWLKGEDGVPALVVYHNDFAAVPLNADVLRHFGITQFRNGSSGEWADA